MSATILGGDVTVYFSTDNTQLRVEWTGSATGTRTMNETYSGSKTLEALSAQMSERIWMTAQTPVDYTAVNGYFFDDTTMEHMTGGTLQSSGWASDVVIRRPYTETVAFIAGDIGKTVNGTTSTHDCTLLDFNATRLEMWLRPQVAGNNMNDAEAFTTTGGTGTGNTAGARSSGESIWSNPNTIAALAPNTLVYIYQGDPTAVDGSDNKARVIATKGTDSWWPEGNIDICLKVQEDGALIDEGYATFFAHQYTQLYSHSVVDLSAGARTPIALETQDDLNNNSGFKQLLTNAESSLDAWSSADVGERINEDVATPTWEAVLTSVTGSGPNYTMQFYPVADLTLPSASDVFEDLLGTKDATMTAAGPTGVNPESAPANTITVTHAFTSQDLNNGNGAQPYSILVDVQATPIQDMYELLKYETRRGETGTGLTDGIEGEQYIGSEMHISYSAPTGILVEGEQVWMHTAGDVLVATAIVVANHQTPDELILRNLRTYTVGPATKIGDNVGGGAYTDFATIDTIRNIGAVKAAPFGTFAGGTFFGGPGVWVTDLFSGDEQAFQLTDDLGVTQSPPNTVSVNVSNLVSGDSVAVYRRVDGTAGSAIDRAEYNPNATQGPATPTTTGITTLTVTGTISNEAPDAGKVKVVDVSNNNETLRYRYSSLTRASGIFTFTGSTGTATGGSTTTIVDTGADFVTDGVEVGDICRNTDDGEEAIVVTVTDLQNLVVTATASTWSGKVYEVNYLARSYVTGDDVWVPFVDRIADAGNENNSIIHTVDIPVRVVIRNAGVIQPEEFDKSITSSGMEQAATRNPDTIFV